MELNMPMLAEMCANLRAKIQPRNGHGPEAMGEIVCYSAETALDGKKLGLENLRWAVLAATGLGEEEKKMLSTKSTQARLQNRGQDLLSSIRVV